MVPRPPYSLDSSTWLSEVGEPFLAPLLGCVGDSIVRHLLIIEAGSSKGQQEQSEEGHRERVSFSARGSGRADATRGVQRDAHHNEEFSGQLGATFCKDQLGCNVLQQNGYNLQHSARCNRATFCKDGYR